MIHPIAEKTPDNDLFKKVPAPPPEALVDLKTLTPGAPSPTRVKFSLGFNAAIRHQKTTKIKLDGVHRAERSPAFLAGYDLGWLFGPKLIFDAAETSAYSAKLDECYRAWLGTYSGTSTTANQEAVAELHCNDPRPTLEERMG